MSSSGYKNLTQQLKNEEEKNRSLRNLSEDNQEKVMSEPQQENPEESKYRTGANNLVYQNLSPTFSNNSCRIHERNHTGYREGVNASYNKEMKTITYESKLAPCPNGIEVRKK